ncbi:uncharacterized protein TRUGW13939_05113 [Talaromyces rugulosus]|uniref:Uncharacterized protein n=1 Tax=Talaromyces rugulosus TaxID=121627 RepID=A0A7H8QZ21_TALRU|nr:uncharacterized protein TRUGW13939_05113 [Talaromyces rugulosus]QKX57993.1 hypothetical protein TRUGW13939_05113 [Talaromyces rugulosus]
MPKARPVWVSVSHSVLTSPRQRLWYQSYAPRNRLSEWLLTPKSTPDVDFTMTTTLERSLSQTSMSSSLLSVHNDITPPAMPDSRLSIAHRIGYLDSQLSDLRSSVLTSDDYVDRRNREDEHVRREFVAQRTVSERIDGNVKELKSDVSKLKYAFGSLQTDTAFLRNDVNRLQSNFQQLESRMSQMERVRFNSLANTIHAPLNPVPKIDEDGTLRYPNYFPRSVWRFWCLKKRSRVHRLVGLAQFYELEGYEYWGRNYQELQPFDDDDSDSSGSSDRPNNLTLAEATYQYPEACHQALAATLGLNYYKIRKEAGEGPNARIARPPKRHPDEIASSNHSSIKVAKVEKKARRLDDVSPTLLKQLVTGVPSVASKSASSEHEDKLRWRGAGSDISDETMSKLKGIASDDVAQILRAIERGRLHVQSEQMNISPTESRRSDAVKADNMDTSPIEEDGASVHTVSTELISPGSSLPDTTSV